MCRTPHVLRVPLTCHPNPNPNPNPDLNPEQVCRAPHVPLTCRRFWEALWFCHVRSLSDTPLAFRLSHQWLYDEARDSKHSHTVASRAP